MVISHNLCNLKQVYNTSAESEELQPQLLVVSIFIKLRIRFHEFQKSFSCLPEYLKSPSFSIIS